MNRSYTYFRGLHDANNEGKQSRHLGLHDVVTDVSKTTLTRFPRYPLQRSPESTSMIGVVRGSQKATRTHNMRKVRLCDTRVPLCIKLLVPTKRKCFSTAIIQKSVFPIGARKDDTEVALPYRQHDCCSPARRDSIKKNNARIWQKMACNIRATSLIQRAGKCHDSVKMSP